MDPLTLLIWVLVVLVIAWVALYLVRTMPVDQPIKTVLSVIVLLAGLLWLLRMVGWL